MELNQKIKSALINIEFSKRYSELVSEFSFNYDEVLEQYENNIILDILNDFGYTAKYDKREDFFYVKEKIDIYTFQFNMSFRYGRIEFIWAVWEDDTLLTGSPWSVLKRLLDGERVKPATFRNYEDLKNILEDSFKLYEDFKLQISK